MVLGLSEGLGVAVFERMRQLLKYLFYKFGLNFAAATVIAKDRMPASTQRLCDFVFKGCHPISDYSVVFKLALFRV